MPSKDTYVLKEITLSTGNVEEVATGSFRIRVSPHWVQEARKKELMIPNVGQMYLVERMNEAGEWEGIPRVKSVNFFAAVNEPALLTIVYYAVTPQHLAQEETNG